MTPVIARPKMKLPCRLAHSVSSGSSHHDGGRAVSTARISAAIHVTISGSARTCGRAMMCGEVSTSAASTAASVGVGRQYLSR